MSTWSKHLPVLVILAAACAACAPNDVTSPTAGPSTVSPTPLPSPTPWPNQFDSPKVYALMHIWYKFDGANCPTVGDPKINWGPWPWNGSLDDPCQTIPGAPWLREISSVTYPLTGPYDSLNPDIIRWQFRQMKAAGLDGAAIPVYSWKPHLDYLFDAFFGTDTTKGILQIAEEENFTVFIEMCALRHDELAEYGQKYLQEIHRQHDAIEASPYKKAYARTEDGRLMYWIPLIGWINDKVAFLDGTDDHPYNVAYLYRNPESDAVIGLNRQLRHAKVQMVSDFGPPGLHGWEPMVDKDGKPFYEQSIEYIKKLSDLGMIPIGDAYIGYDERGGIIAPGMHYGRYGLRNGVGHMLNYLERSRSAGVKIVLLESFNEHGEGSTLEACININRWRPRPSGEINDKDLYLDDQGNNDPFKYQKAVALQFFGKKEWRAPQPPPCSAIDPRLLQNAPSWLLDLIQCTR